MSVNDYLQDKYVVDEKEYHRLLLQADYNTLSDFVQWSISAKRIYIHEKLNHLFTLNPFLYRLIFDYGYKELLTDKNTHHCIGEYNSFDFDHTISIQFNDIDSHINCSDTITGILTFPYLQWEEVLEWSDKAPTNYMVYIVNPLLIFYGVGTYGLFLTPSYYEGAFIELCNNYIISLTGYPLFLTIAKDLVDNIHIEKLECDLSKEMFLEDYLEIEEDKGLKKLARFWYTTSTVSVDYFDEYYEYYQCLQPYPQMNKYEDINYIRITSEAPFRLEHEKTGETIGTFHEFTLDARFNVIDTEKGEHHLTEKQTFDILNGEYDFIL